MTTIADYFKVTPLFDGKYLRNGTRYGIVSVASKRQWVIYNEQLSAVTCCRGSYDSTSLLSITHDPDHDHDPCCPRP